MTVTAGGDHAAGFIDRLDLTEPVDVFVVLIVSAVRAGSTNAS